MRLVHPGVDKKTGVAELCDLLCEKFHTRHRIAEDDRLIDLQLREQCVQAVHLLALLDERVELRDAFEGELVHQVDFMRFGHVLVLELQDGHREGRREHQDLPVSRQKLEKVFDDRLELRAQQLVRLVHHKHLALVQLAHCLVRQVENASRCGHDNMHLVVQPHDVLPQAGATGGDHALHVHVLAQLLHHGRRLEGELARRHKDQSLDCALRGRALLKQGDAERAGLACAVLRPGQDGLPGECHWNAVLLNRRGLLVPLLENTHQ
mmetsp:Transcript_73835/g.213891  ORF Transcript_73835/g.213891 Transcript_73835/m.213891 type:complete len:265 (+) Transcript_73835:476-1270(+)